MTRVLPLSLLLVGAGAHVAVAEPAATPCVAVLDIHVVDAANHAPIGDAQVQLGDGEARATDAEGHVVLRGVCPGPQVVTLSHDVYDAALREVEVRAVGTTVVEIALDAIAGETIDVVDDAAAEEDLRATTTLTGEDLERTRGRAFADALAGIPGVALLETGAGLAKPIVRGQLGRRLALLVDGVRHRAQDWGLDHTPEIDPFAAGAITVVRGASGVAHGPDAIGGAILVEPPPLPRLPGASGEVHFTSQTNGAGAGLAARWMVAPARWPGWAGAVEGSARGHAGARTPDYALDNTGNREAMLGARVERRRGETRLTLAFRRYQAELGVCSCLRLESREDFLAQLERQRPVDADRYRSEFGIDRPSQSMSHDLALVRAERRLGDGTLRTTLAGQYDSRREYDVVRRATTGPQFDFRLATLDAESRWAHDPVHLGNHLHLDGQFGVTGMAQRHAYTGLPLVPDHVGGALGAYAIERLIGHDVEIEGGLRYDLTYRRASIERTDFLRLVRSGQLDEGACGPLGDTAECASTFHTLAASLGALRRFGEHATLRAEASTASRPPAPDEQYLNGTSPTFPILGLGKPDLGPETTYAGSVTGSYGSDRLAVELSAHASHVDDYIYLAPARGPDGAPIFDVLIRGTFPRFATTAVDARFIGADGGVTARPWPWLEVAGTFSWVRGTNTDDGRPLPLVPPVRATGSLTVRGDDVAGLGPSYVTVDATAVARQRRVDPDADLAPPPPAYALLGGELGMTLRNGDVPLRLALTVTNALDVRHRDYTSLLRYFADQPGRQVALRLTVPIP